MKQFEGTFGASNTLGDTKSYCKSKKNNYEKLAHKSQNTFPLYCNIYRHYL